MKRFALIAIVAVFAAACSSTKITSDYDKTVDFTQYKTAEYYGWEENSNKILTRFDQERIEKAFGEEFQKRNIKFVEQGKGDIVVSLYIVTEQKQQTTATTTGVGGGYGGYYGYGPGYGWGGGMSTTTYNTYDYTVGTLLISVYDAKEKKLVWQTRADGEVEENPEAREKSIPYMAAKMMAKYPVKPVSNK